MIYQELETLVSTISSWLDASTFTHDDRDSDGIRAIESLMLLTRNLQNALENIAVAEDLAKTNLEKALVNIAFEALKK